MTDALSRDAWPNTWDAGDVNPWAVAADALRAALPLCDQCAAHYIGTGRVRSEVRVLASQAHAGLFRALVALTGVRYDPAARSFGAPYDEAAEATALLRCLVLNAAVDARYAGDLARVEAVLRGTKALRVRLFVSVLPEDDDAE